jgi:CubicO group peptidase (beta-lactamase class C family)
VLDLTDQPDAKMATDVEAIGLTRDPAFSALVVAQGAKVLFQTAAPDFGPDRLHSLQSISKMHMHLIMSELFAEGRLRPSDLVGDHLPWIGSAYATASLQDVLDMNVENDFSEDYSDPHADCFREEEALGWRLPPDDRSEETLRSFLASLTGAGTANPSPFCRYKSANTDVLTMIASAHVNLLQRVQMICDAAGYEGCFHISLSPDHLPAFSGGGCLSARDLARFGLLFARRGEAVFGPTVGTPKGLDSALIRAAPRVSPKRGLMRYSNHLMTNGRWIGHAGYGGQFLMVDMVSGRVAAFLSVLENDSGYDEDYMVRIISSLEGILRS